MALPALPFDLRPLAPADLLDAAAVVKASGLGTSIDEMQRHRALPGAELVGAWRDGRLVAVAGAISYGTMGVIGPMSVLPEEQGRGIGTALLHRVVDWLQRYSVALITLDATAAGAPLYRRYGFVADYWTLHMERREAHHGDTVPEDGIVTAVAGDDVAMDLFDRPIFGASRCDLLRSYLADFPGRAVVLRRAGAVAGYAVAQRRRIGPFVGDDLAAAAMLLARVVCMPYDGNAIISLPEPNEAGCALLRRWGFVETRRLERLRLGGHAHPGDPKRVYGLASYALG